MKIGVCYLTDIMSVLSNSFQYHRFVCKLHHQGQRYYNKTHCLLFDACGYIFVCKYLYILYEVTVEQFVDNKARFAH